MWSPLAGGLLTGRHRRGRQPDSFRSRFGFEHLSDERRIDAVERLVPVAQEAGMPLTHMAMAFAISHPGVTSAIAGPRTMGHLDDLLAGAGTVLDDEVLDRIDGIVPPGTDVQFMKTLIVCERHNLIKPVSQQIYYTPRAREAEYEMIPAAIDQGIANQIWSPLGAGSLTGKFRRDQPEVEGTRQTDGGWTAGRVPDKENMYDMVDVLSEIADDKGVTIPQVVLSWVVMARPFVSSVVVGARSVEQWEDSLGALDVALTDDEKGRIDAVSPPPMAYPFWHQADLATDRLGPADEDIIKTMEQTYLS